MYALAADAMGVEKVEEILNANGDGPSTDTKAKARREREAVEAALRETH